MSATKRIDGDYEIISTNKTPGNDDPGFASVILDTNFVNIKGNLQVDGDATFVNKEDVAISDNIIVLNQGETGAGVTLDFSGIEVDRGTEPKADFLWDEILDRWTMDHGDGTRYNVLRGLPAQGDPLFNVVEDLSPQLGADLDVNGFSIVSVSNGNIVLRADGTGEIRMETPVVVSGTEPTAVAAGDVALFQAADIGGGTQLHYKNDTDTDELVSRSKAIAYSLIF